MNQQGMAAVAEMLAWILLAMLVFSAAIDFVRWAKL